MLRLITVNDTTIGWNLLYMLSVRRMDLYLNKTQHSLETILRVPGGNQTPNPAIYRPQTSVHLASTLRETYSVSIGKTSPIMKFREIISLFI